MVQLPKFTQYYIVSMIFPGIFNALAVIYSFHLAFFPIIDDTFNTYQWLFILFSALILTLSLGMSFEKSIFNAINRTKKPDRIFKDYKEFSEWRNKLVAKIRNNDDVKTNYIIKCTEKLMSEYYCFNNIIIGVVSSLSIFALYYRAALREICAPQVIITVLLLGSLVPIARTMRIWLHELHSFQNLKDTN